MNIGGACRTRAVKPPGDPSNDSKASEHRRLGEVVRLDESLGLKGDQDAGGTGHVANFRIQGFDDERRCRAQISCGRSTVMPQFDRGKRARVDFIVPRAEPRRRVFRVKVRVQGSSDDRGASGREGTPIDV